MPVEIHVDESHPYFDLVKVFEAAFNQASSGKGSERHAYGNAEKYSDQLICEMDRRLHGNAAGPRYQAVKKIYESARMDHERAIKELLGAINYTAAAVILLKEKIQAEETLYGGNESQKKRVFYELKDPLPPKTAAEKKESDIDDDLFDDNFGNDSLTSRKTDLGE